MGEISKLYKKVANDPTKQDAIFDVLEHFEKPRDVAPKNTKICT